MAILRASAEFSDPPSIGGQAVGVGWYTKRVTSLRSRRSRAGRSSVGKRQWRVTKRDLVDSVAARRGFDGMKEKGGAVDGRESKTEAIKARVVGRMYVSIYGLDQEVVEREG